MTSSNRDYRLLFTVGLIRALDTRRLSREQWDMLTGSASIKDFMNILADTVYREHLEGAPGDHLLHEISRRRRDLLYDLVSRFSFDAGLAALLVAGYDFHNLRVMLRESLFGRSLNELLVPWGLIEEEYMREVFQLEQYQLFPYEMQMAVVEAVEAYYKQKDIMVMDGVIDRWCYHAMLSGAKSIESDFIVRHLQLGVDCENIETVLRALRRGEEADQVRVCMINGGTIPGDLLIESGYGEKGAISKLLSESGYEGLVEPVMQYHEHPYVFGDASANMKGKMLRETDYLICGSEPLYAYVQRVEHELSVLGSIAAMTAGEIDAAEIREKVPEFW